MEDKRLNKRQYSANGGSAPIVKNRAPKHLRPNDQPLLMSGQPQIMAAGPGQPHYYPYPQAVQMVPQVPQPQAGYLFPEHQLIQASFDNR